jgi:hypothetical protein
MSSVALGPSKIEGHICPRTRVEEGAATWVLPPRELFSIPECPGNRVRYTAARDVSGDKIPWLTARQQTVTPGSQARPLLGLAIGCFGVK